MSNMSYCRFENTRGDLQDCLDALPDWDDLSVSEQKHARAMYKLCLDYVDQFEFHPGDTPQGDGGEE